VSGDWLPPRSCSVIGASHRRRGQPCQDASLACGLRADGGTLQLMAVADGHGSSRYWLSQVGSALACQQVRQAVATALQHTPLADQQRWRELLRRELPEAIVQGWLAAISADWQQRPEAAQQAFTPATYGCTLGLVLMAPQWWGCTGLGDWDLVLIPAHGAAQLISQEDPAAAGHDNAEATASLCLPQAAGLCTQRATLAPLIRAHEAAGAELTLLLSSDGVRKSCATDADFLELCGQLAAIETQAELAEGLAHITGAGSGDDVSVAVGRTGCGATATALPARIERPKCGNNGGDLRRPPLMVLTLLLMASATGLGLAGWGWWRQRAGTPRPPAAAKEAEHGAPPPPVLKEIERQCKQPPARIRANLSQRRMQFRQLQQAGDRQRALAMLEAADRDPLGALIAASRLGPLTTCAPLDLALDQQWQPLPPAAGAGRSPGRMPAIQPPQPSRQP